MGIPSKIRVGTLIKNALTLLNAATLSAKSNSLKVEGTLGAVDGAYLLL